MKETHCHGIIYTLLICLINLKKKKNLKEKSDNIR